MLPFSQNPALVLISILVAVIGSLAGLALIWGVSGGRGKRGSAHLYRGAAVIGGSIWSMHFIGMTSVRTSVHLSYDVLLTIISLLIAIVLTGAGLFLVDRRMLGRFSVPGAGLLMGSGVGAMHYLGMSAIRGCSLSYTFGGVLLSVLIGIVASTVALAFIFSRRGIIQTVLGSVVLGLAISSMHYSAMAATIFYPEREPMLALIGVLGQNVIGYVVGVAIFLTCGVIFARMAAPA
jgi:NO-binding membrane sensor protein with MHYT domain